MNPALDIIAIEACARAGWKAACAVGGFAATWDQVRSFHPRILCATADVLTGRDTCLPSANPDEHAAFARAILAHAVKLCADAGWERIGGPRHSELLDFWVLTIVLDCPLPCCSGGASWAAAAKARAATLGLTPAALRQLPLEPRKSGPAPSGSEAPERAREGQEDGDECTCGDLGQCDGCHAIAARHPTDAEALDAEAEALADLRSAGWTDGAAPGRLTDPAGECRTWNLVNAISVERLCRRREQEAREIARRGYEDWKRFQALMGHGSVDAPVAIPPTYTGEPEHGPCPHGVLPGSVCAACYTGEGERR